MYKGESIGVVVPAFNEEKLIGQVLDTMPDFVDQIIVIDDCSKDRTAEIVESYCKKQDSRVLLLQHQVNQGVGGAIATGYKWCRDHDIDVAVVMAGDAQMDPDDLPALLDPVVSGEVDYAKGNRLISGEAWKIVPKVRYLGNSTLSLLTKIASGYWHVADSQTGYTAIRLEALRTLDLDGIYKRYGMPNDLLVKLNIHNFRVRDVEIKPVYDIGEVSGLKPFRSIPKLSWLMVRLFITRMIHKYVIRDFHPLVLFYLSGIVLALSGTAFGFYVVFYRLFVGSVTDNTPLFSVFLFVMGWQFILFAMWCDMEYNKELK